MIFYEGFCAENSSKFKDTWAIITKQNRMAADI